MRVGTWIACWLALVASSSSTFAQQKSPYQSNTNAAIPPVIPVPVVVLPSPSPPLQPIANQPSQPVASPPIPTAPSVPPKITVVVPYTPTQPLRPNNGNFLVRLVGHLVGPTKADWAIQDTPDSAVDNNVTPLPPQISELASVSPIALQSTTTNCCCDYRPYVPISSYFSFLRFRSCDTWLSTRARPAPPRFVAANGPQPRAFDTSFRNHPADARLSLDPTQPPAAPNP